MFQHLYVLMYRFLFCFNYACCFFSYSSNNHRRVFYRQHIPSTADQRFLVNVNPHVWQVSMIKAFWFTDWMKPKTWTSRSQVAGEASIQIKESRTSFICEHKKSEPKSWIRYSRRNVLNCFILEKKNEWTDSWSQESFAKFLILKKLENLTFVVLCSDIGELSFGVALPREDTCQVRNKYIWWTSLFKVGDGQVWE